jgi:hypothetical protein
MADTMRIQDAVEPLRRVLTELRRHPALTPLSEGLMIEMPCCGFRFDAEAIECSQDGPSRVFWPPRWTCSQCNRTFAPNADSSSFYEKAIRTLEGSESSSTYGTGAAAENAKT